MKLDISTYTELDDPESIRRCKQKVVEDHPELDADEKTKSMKNGLKQLKIMCKQLQILSMHQNL